MFHNYIINYAGTDLMLHCCATVRCINVANRKVNMPLCIYFCLSLCIYFCLSLCIYLCMIQYYFCLCTTSNTKNRRYIGFKLKF